MHVGELLMPGGGIFTEYTTRRMKGDLEVDSYGGE